MKGKEFLDKFFLVEGKGSKIRKGINIFYEIKTEIFKKQTERELNKQPAPTEQPVSSEQPAPTEQPVSSEQPAPAEQSISQDKNKEKKEDEEASIQTESKDEIYNDENKIIRKIENSLCLDREEVDDVQGVEDIIQILSERKHHGIKILDEFSAEILNDMLFPETRNEIPKLIDKKSYIFVQIMYGYHKDDSVGIRFLKRKNSDSVIINMLVNNKIINLPANIDLINEKITSYRNDIS